MIIKKAKEKKRCSKCGAYRGLLHDDILGCDCCEKVIDLNDDSYKGKVSPYLKATVFYEDDESSNIDLIFCSWKCLYKKLKEYKNKKGIHFIALPYLCGERDIKDKYRGDFFECIKEEL